MMMADFAHGLRARSVMAEVALVPQPWANRRRSAMLMMADFAHGLRARSVTLMMAGDSFG